MPFFLLLASSLATLSQALPSLSLPAEISSSPNLYPRAVCSGNSASNRTEWCDYDITTDYYTTVPDTGVTREYWLEITDGTVAPDGVSRYAQFVNGTIPGPTLIADWGDTVVVHVTNSLSQSTNGSSLHFHGIRQNSTNPNDGVPSITQCPTTPGNTTTYTWRATQYGSTWYHSHFALQAWEGVFGGILINGPASANYDEDLGVVFLNDWNHQTVDELYAAAQASGPPTLDNGLINGTNVYGDDGSRFTVGFTSGTSYRMRLVNAAIDTHFKFSIDNHTMLVIAMDLVPIEPFNTKTFRSVRQLSSVSMLQSAFLLATNTLIKAQRYDIVVTADQASVADNFWMRAIPQSACSDNDSADNIRGIVYYGSTASTPTTTGYDYPDGCVDEDVSDLVPVVSKTVDSPTYDEVEDVSLGFNSDKQFRWSLNSTSMVVDWADPSLAQVVAGVTTFNTSDAVIELPDADVWVYLIIESSLSISHPIHLHCYDFFVLAQATGTYDASTTTLSLDNPPRRDTAILLAGGYLVLAFQTDNPGAWLCHCHIGWHTEEGFALQFVVRESEIAALVDNTTLTDTCDTWTAWAAQSTLVQDDSGV